MLRPTALIRKNALFAGNAQDDRVAAFGIIGIVNWTTTWFAPGRSPSVDQIAEQLADMAVRSVAVSADRQQDFTNPEAALKCLREDLDQLEHALKSKHI